MLYLIRSLALLACGLISPLIHAQVNPPVSPQEARGLAASFGRAPARIPIFYPPIPPAPGESVDRVAALQITGWDAPTELSAFIGEPFYSPLASLISEGEITASQQAKLNDFVERRNRLVVTLRESLARGSADNNTLSREIEALEKSADELRVGLTAVDLSWGYYRYTPLREIVARAAPALERQVFRAAVYEEPELSFTQRRLLADLANALGRSGKSLADLKPPSVAAGTWIGFLPETSFLRLPANLSPDLAAGFTAFLSEKMAIQRELATVVWLSDRESLAHRRAAFAELGKRQEPRLAALEEHAEMLRRGIAGLPAERPPILPTHVVQLSRQLLAIRNDLQQKLIARLIETRTHHCRYSPGMEEMVWVPALEDGNPQNPRIDAALGETPAQRGRASEQRRMFEKIVSDFARATEREKKMADALRTEIFNATLRALYPDHSVSESASEPQIARVTAVLREAEIAGRIPAFEQYLVATLRPGLSAAQRRLLFAASLRDLAFPFRPASGGRSWN